MSALTWRPRFPPLPVQAAVFSTTATHDSIGPLRARLQKPHPSWRGIVVQTPPLVLLLGQELPWIDGVQYFGIDPVAPGLLMPTQLQPDLPADLVERFLQRQLAHLNLPVLLFPDGRVLEAGPARPIDPVLLPKLGLGT